MKLVLVAGMNSRVNGIGPKVRLAEGTYKLCVENHKDCEVVLHAGYGREFPCVHGGEFYSWGEIFNVDIRGGTEDYINVFAEFINGPVAATTS